LRRRVRPSPPVMTAAHRVGYTAARAASRWAESTPGRGGVGAADAAGGAAAERLGSTRHHPLPCHRVWGNAGSRTPACQPSAAHHVPLVGVPAGSTGRPVSSSAATNALAKTIEPGGGQGASLASVARGCRVRLRYPHTAGRVGSAAPLSGLHNHWRLTVEGAPLRDSPRVNSKAASLAL